MDNTVESPQSPDWNQITFHILMGLLAIGSGFLIITDQYWPSEKSVQNGKALIWVNWLNALLTRPPQTRLTPRQKHFFGYIGVIGGLLLLCSALLMAFGQ